MACQFPIETELIKILYFDHFFAWFQFFLSTFIDLAWIDGEILARFTPNCCGNNISFQRGSCWWSDISQTFWDHFSRHLFIQVLIMSISEPKISVPDKMTWPMELKPHLIFVRRLLSSTYRLPRLIHTYVSRCRCTSVLLLADHHRVFQVIWNRSSVAKILLFSYFM